MKLIRENNKTILSVTLLIILITPVFGNFARVFLFKNVQIPFNIKYKNSKIKSGKYDINPEMIGMQKHEFRGDSLNSHSPYSLKS